MKYISYKESTITEEERKNNNEKYIKEMIQKENDYFKTMFKDIDKNIKLDDEQKRIILTDEDNLMIIAGAGAGKTTTITAKVNYLIEKQNVKDNEILVISFTNKAVKELQERINKEFKHKVNVTTFHKLAFEIIKNNTKKPPTIITDNTNIIKKYIEANLTNEEQLKFIELYSYFYLKRKKVVYINLERIKLIKIVIKKIESINKPKIELNKIIEKDKNCYNEFINLCATYINLLKAKNITLKNQTQKNHITNIFTKFIKGLYEFYEKELAIKNQIDFNDLINKARNIIETQNQPNIKYKYIIIDEYQDISENRFKLIETITKKINNKTMIVGDDWQCIYSFASSNINLFTNYKNRVDYCTTLKITKTYRNSQELIDIAGKFIQKNENQIKKRLISNKTNKTPITIIKYKKLTESLKNALEYLITKYGENKNILLLGRYTFDINKINDNQITINNNIITYKNKKTLHIEFMTTHSAKGLGFDNVIIINAINGTLGFPSKIKTNQFIENLITQEQNIKYAEERRLFYVALTRTKNETIILTPKENPSIFIKEIKKYKNVITKSNKI